MTPKVHVQLAAQLESGDGEGDIPDPRDFQRWAATVVHDDAASGSPSAATSSATIGVRIVGDGEGRRFNRDYCGIDKATNVLAFPFATESDEEQHYLGDIVMTAPLIAAEARAQNKMAHEHWAHLFIHAVLHLQGYRHDSRAAAALMQRRESAIMQQLGLADPWTNGEP